MIISLRSKITRELLNYFFIHDKEEFYIRQIARDLGEYSANVRKQLLVLLNEGILKDRFKGKERFFFLNQDYRFLKEYKEMTRNSFGIEVMLKERLSNIDGIKKAIIFGSYAQDKLTPASDIDVLVVGDYDYNKLYKEIADVQRTLKIEVNPTEYSTEEYGRKIKEKDNFLVNILKNKVINVI